MWVLSAIYLCARNELFLFSALLGTLLSAFIILAIDAGPKYIPILILFPAGIYTVSVTIDAAIKSLVVRPTNPGIKFLLLEDISGGAGCTTDFLFGFIGGPRKS